MNLDELTGRLDNLIVTLQDGLRREVETVAQDGLVLLTQRVSETGKDAEGRSFPPYTPEYERYKRGAVGAAKKEGKERKAARKTAKASKDKPVGRYRGFVDFTLTGQMLSSIGLQETQTNPDRITVRVAGRDETTQLKMEGNDEHRPGWFRLSKDEIAELAGQSQERLSTFVQNFLTT